MGNTHRIKPGDSICDFVLSDQDGQQVNIRDLRGKKVVLSFHPLAWTSICAKQMMSLEANRDRFRNLDTVAMGFSVDSVASKKAWAEKELEIKHTRLLADFWPHGGVASRLGIFRDNNGFSERANIVLDENHKVIFIKVYEISMLPDIEEIIEVLKQ